MASIHLRLLLAASLLVSAVAGCAPADETEDDEAASAESAATAHQFQPLRAELPVKDDAEEVFASEKEIRSYFGTSCGFACTTPWAGALPFTIERGEYVVLISRAKSAPGRGFRIATTRREGNPKYVRVKTCPTTSRVPYALVKVKPNFLTIWASDEGTAESCP